jgi:hypothetical protein
MNELELGLALQLYGINPNPHILRLRNIQPDIVSAYFNTRYCITSSDIDVDLILGKQSDELDSFLEKQGAESWAFISAWNPFSEQLSDEENQFRHEKMCNLLTSIKFSFCEGEGVSSDGKWKERSALIVGASLEFGESLGALLGQNAIVYGEINKPALILFCERHISL